MTMNHVDIAPSPTNVYNIGGFVDDRFRPVRCAFEKNFVDGLEPDGSGATFAVYHKDRLVVDLYGGCANDDDGRSWQSDTLSTMFSTTKSITSLVFATLVDRELVAYTDKVVDYWPEYGKFGKEQTTIEQVLLHQAGIPYGNDDLIITIDDVRSPQRMSEIIENLKPLWIPGKRVGYHALLFGFIVDQLVRRIDPKRRGVADYFRDEITQKYSIPDICIGLTDNDCNKRVSQVQYSSEDDLTREAKRNPIAMVHYRLADNEHYAKLYHTFPWLLPIHYNQPSIRQLQIASSNGLTTARSMAKVHSLVVERKLITNDRLLQMLMQPKLVDEIDIINGYAESKGYGFQYTKNLLNQWIFGHSGLGGQNVRIDMHNQLAYAYFCNRLKAADNDCVDTFTRLQSAVYQCL